MNEDANEIEMLDIPEKLENDFSFFVSFVHKRLENENFIWSPYNKRLVKELLKVYDLKYLYLIINIPPRLGKTILLTYFLAWTQLRDSKRVYNNYYTYADILVDKLYSKMEDIFKIHEIDEIVDTSFKKKKEDFSNKSSCGVYATTIFGKTTGFGAGKKEDEDKFSGCIVIDDPHKASDSIVKIASANRAVKSSILNRKNNSKVPIILIMQRLHKLDLTGFLLNLYDDFFKNGRAYHLKMPVLKENRTISKREYPLDLIELERKKDEKYFLCQLQQEPIDASGKYFSDDMFDIKDNISEKNSHTVLYFNPEKAVDPIIFLAFAKNGNNIVIVDYFEEKLDPKNFFNALIDFCKKNNSKNIFVPASLMNKTLQKKLRYFRVKEVSDLHNVELSAFYSIALLEKGKIILKDNDNSIPLKEEMKLFPDVERNYIVKSIVTAIEILFVNCENHISSSI